MFDLKKIMFRFKNVQLRKKKQTNQYLEEYLL